MTEFWENTFREVETMWGFKPADSAIQTSDFFKINTIQNILIPGVGYGRNARVFLDNDIRVTGIEISETAIRLAREKNGFDFIIHHGSVNLMPFDSNIYDGIYCYALIHLLNKHERKHLIKSCYHQLKKNGYMIFVAVSKKATMYGNGRQISKDRFKIQNGLEIFFYDLDTAAREFKDFGLVEVKEVDEPIKHEDNQPPLKCILIKCKK